mgnify:CR=1 FL=1
MAITVKKLQENVRNGYVEKVRLSFEQLGEEVLTVASNEIAIPCLDEEGNEQWVCIKVSVPTGGRDGSAYDGYEMADDYKMKCEEKVAKAKANAEAKARKKAMDEKLRQQKREQREKAKANV